MAQLSFEKLPQKWKIFFFILCILIFINMSIRMTKFDYNTRNTPIRWELQKETVFNNTTGSNATASESKEKDTRNRLQKIFEKKKHELLETLKKINQPATRPPYRNADKTVVTARASTMPGLISMDRDLSLPPEVPLRPDSKEPILQYSQQRDYKALISHDDVCGSNGHSEIDLSLKNFDYNSDIFMLIIIKSACGLKMRRDAIRDTWGNEVWIKKNLGVNVKRFFLLGACTDNERRQIVKKENEENNDILQWDFFDSFRNLTLKDCLFLQWYAKTCQNVPYIFKGDDDVFVNVRNIVNHLKKLPVRERENLFLGSVLVGSPRILDPRWKYYVSYNLYPEKFYPPYVSGGGFVMSGKIVVKLFLTTLKTRIIPIDDAFLGILLKQIGVEPQNDKGFKSWGMKVSDVCRLAKIKTFHKMLPDRLYSVWSEYAKLNISECDKSSDDVFRKR